MNTIKVLSIDLDIIFEPIILYYRHMIGGAPKARIWNEIEEGDLIKSPSYNSYIYKKLQNIFNLDQLKQLKHIYIGENHSSIILALNHIYQKGKIKFSVTNIDHHHDIHYNKFQEEDAYKYKISTCASWVSYLDACEVLKDYTWVRAINSDPYIGPSFIHQEVDINEYLNHCQELLSQFDYLYVTTSDKWCPPQYRYLLDDLIQSIKDSAKCPVMDFGYTISHPDNAPIKYFI